MTSPAVFALLAFVALFWYASPGLRLEAGKAGRQWSRVRTASGFLIVSLLGIGASSAVAVAQTPEPAATPAAVQQSLQVAIDMGAQVVKAGTPVTYNTVVTNTGAEASPPLIVAMNIINLNAKGDVV